MTTKKSDPTFKNWSLSRVFLAASIVVMGSATLVVGNWVSGRIENAVVQLSANSAALYMESILSPLSQELAFSDTLSEPATRALVELFSKESMQERIVSYKIWKPDGLIAYASNSEIVGKKFPLTDDLKQAWGGEISGSYKNSGRPENAAEVALGIPLLEVYSPIREIWTGEIIAVGEFYQRADQLERDLLLAKRTSWLVVATTFAISSFVLFLIVAIGDRTIRLQADLLEKRLAESQKMSRQNAQLRARVIDASERASAQSDRILRKLGSELHDGPAQHLALAVLRLEAAFPTGTTTTREAEEIQQSLQKALLEIRALSRGLAAPDIDALSFKDVVSRAVADHSEQSPLRPTISFHGGTAPLMSYAEKLCVFRFLQETLSNTARYATEADCTVTCSADTESITVSVCDDGPGFNPSAGVKVSSEGGQGLMGLRDRVESIGGQFEVTSELGKGTCVTMKLFPRQARAE
ncbi:MAG: sensor histidine kinase [Ruegeria sp.]